MLFFIFISPPILGTAGQSGNVETRPAPCPVFQYYKYASSRKLNGIHRELAKPPKRTSWVIRFHLIGVNFFLALTAHSFSMLIAIISVI